jgi:hypothetical protein
MQYLQQQYIVEFTRKSQILEIYKALDSCKRYIYFDANIAGIFSLDMTLTPEAEVTRSSFPVTEGLFLGLAIKL